MGISPVHNLSAIGAGAVSGQFTYTGRYRTPTVNGGDQPILHAPGSERFLPRSSGPPSQMHDQFIMTEIQETYQRNNEVVRLGAQSRDDVIRTESAY